MEVTCMIRGNGNTGIDETDGNKFLYISNAPGYNTVKVSIREYIDGEYSDIAWIDVDGVTLVRAINNAMND